MDQTFSVPDSTDWLTTKLSGLAPVEAALRCQVCKDFFDTPMMTSCSHTFCSLCIRRCLASDGRCPTCRAGDQAGKLRMNWSIQEIVESFAAAREGILGFAKTAAEKEEELMGSQGTRAAKKLKRKIADTDMEDEDEDRRSWERRTRSGTRLTDPRSAKTDIIAIPDSEDEAEEKEILPNDGLVACPVCLKRMKEEAVFPHLDRCNGKPASDEKPKAPKSRLPEARRFTRSAVASNSPLLSQELPRRRATPQTHLPQLNYSLLKDTQLRKKLQELGIPSYGSRQTLARRHTEWVNLWNANCDSTRPRSKRDLLHDLDGWERSQGGGGFSGFSSAASLSQSNVMRKDFNGKQWAQNNRDQFEDLIAKARANAKTKRAETATPQPSESQAPGVVDQENDPPPTETPVHRSPQLVTSNTGTNSSPTRPRQKNYQGIASIVDKVEEANLNQACSSSPGSLNTQTDRFHGGETPMNFTSNPHTSTQEPPDGPSSLPRQIASPSPPKALPMFQVTEERAVGVDGEMAAI